MDKAKDERTAGFKGVSIGNEQRIPVSVYGKERGWNSQKKTDPGKRVAQKNAGIQSWIKEGTAADPENGPRIVTGTEVQNSLERYAVSWTSGTEEDTPWEISEGGTGNQRKASRKKHN